jgi:hypothetical protein
LRCQAKTWQLKDKANQTKAKQVFDRFAGHTYDYQSFRLALRDRMQISTLAALAEFYVKTTTGTHRDRLWHALHTAGDLPTAIFLRATTPLRVRAASEHRVVQSFTIHSTGAGD